jgi:RNA polymerase sigma-70 factor (ECF subfamily)
MQEPSPEERPAGRRPEPRLDPKTLFEKHGAFVQALARGLVADEHMAEDMAHDTWAAVIRRPPTGVRDIRAWLSTVLQRRVASYRRGARKNLGLESAALTVGHGATDDAAQQLEYEHVLHGAVRALGEPYRSTIYLRFHEGLPPRSIAARTGVPVKTVKTRLSRALAQLRGTLDAKFPPDDTSARNWRQALAPIGGAGLNTLKLGGTSAPLLFGMKKLIIALGLVLLSIAWFVQGRVSTGPAQSATTPAPEEIASLEQEPTESASGLDEPARPSSSRALSGSISGDAGEDTATGDAALENAALLVDVVDADGLPIAGRAVILKDRPWRRTGAPWLVRRTDAAGRVAFHGLDPEHYVAKDGLGEQEDGVILESGETKHLRWTLDSDVRVRGRVLDEKGLPAPGADIWFAASEEPSEKMLWAARAEIDGTFTLSGSAAGAIQAAAPGKIPASAQAIRRLPEVEPGVREVTLCLGAFGASLKGRVVDVGGAPVSGASIVIQPEDAHARPVRTLSDPTGEFEWPSGLPKGDHPTTVRARGFAATHTFVTIGLEPRAAEFVLHRGVSLSGTLTHEDGTLASEGHVWIDAANSRWQTYGSDYGPSVETDDQGRFTLRDVPPGRHFIRAQASWSKALARITEPIEVPSHDLEGLQLTLESGRTIRGSIKDPEGSPIPGMVVTAMGEGAKSNDVATDAYGSFALTAIPEQDGDLDEWRVLVRAWTGVNVRVVAERHGVAPNGDDVDFVIERVEEATATIQGRIVAETTPIAGDIEIILGEEGSRGGSAVSFDAESGAFSRGPLRPGAYQLRLLRAGVPVVARSGLVVAAGETIDAGVVRLDDGGSIELSPVLPADLALQGSALDAALSEAAAKMLGPGKSEVALEWSRGAWRHVGTVEAGAWRVIIDAEPLFSVDHPVQVEPGAHQAIELPF